jgi:hypothetical protein
MLTGVLVVLAVVIFILYMARRNSRKNRERGPK